MNNTNDVLFNFLKENNISITGVSLEFLKNKNLKDTNLIPQLKEIEERYENSPNEYSEEIMTYLRQRKGLEKYDTSEDETINNMDKSEVFDNVVSWNNLPGWSSTIKNWIKEIYKIDIDDFNSI